MSEVEGLLKYTRVLKMTEGANDELLEAQNELREWVTGFRAEQPAFWSENYDPALVIKYEAMIRAIEKLLLEI